MIKMRDVKLFIDKSLMPRGVGKVVFPSLAVTVPLKAEYGRPTSVPYTQRLHTLPNRTADQKPPNIIN